MPATLLPAVEIDPPIPATSTVICLHGLGADGHDLAMLAMELSLPKHDTRFVFPHAPQRPVTINNDYVIPAWYDIYGFGINEREDDAGLAEAESMLHALIQREIDKGIASESIVLAGFSQGGAVVLHTGLRYPQRLAGVVAMSSYLPLTGKLRAEAHSANSRLPIMITHGLHDDVIPLAHAEISRDVLQKQGYDVTWRSYPMAHNICAEEIQDISRWLLSVLV